MSQLGFTPGHDHPFKFSNWMVHCGFLATAVCGFALMIYLQ